MQMKPGVFREEYIAIIVRELLRGLDYLHTEGKLHRDIKGAPFYCGFQMFSVAYLDPNPSGQHSFICRRRGEARGLRCLRAIVRDAIGEEEYICRDAVLDVTRSYKAEWL